MTPNSAFIPDITRELPPRDFSARLRRSRLRSLRAAKAPRHYGRRALVLVAAFALPAFAAPAQWGFEIGAAGRAEAEVTPMPFERAGESFPGAAFYYLASDPAPDSANQPLGEGIHSDAEP